MKLKLPEYRYCPVCGSPVDVITYEGRRRPVCGSCGHVIYVNPVPATCQVVLNGQEILLTLRGVEPHKGEWCLPGGFIEWGESPEEGAKRELFEETSITAEKVSLIGVYDSITKTDRHVLLVAYHVLAWSGEPAPGDDADDVRWFSGSEIPPLAFNVHRRVLKDVHKGKIVI